MFDIFMCIRDQHNPWFVVLAIGLCVMSATSAVLLLRHARHCAGMVDMRWIAIAAVAVGFGIWATHFVAMLGYDPGIVAGYDLSLTAMSLAAAIVMTALSFHVSTLHRTPKGFAVASLLSGGGIAAMHYIGMKALELPADLRWRPEYVAASIIFAVVPAYPALMLAVRGYRWGTGIAAGLLLALSILLLHFTGMAGLVLTPAQLPLKSGILLSSDEMAIMIGGGAFGLLLCISVLLVSWRARIAINTRERHLDAALANMQQGLCLFDANRRLVLRNERFNEIWGLPADACVPGMTLEEIARVALESRTQSPVSQEQIDQMNLLLGLALADPDLPPVESDFGTGLTVSIASRALPDGGWLTTFEDITERRRSEKQIAHMALHDSLTGLPNRSHFNRWLDRTLDQARGSGRRVAAIVVDLDRFKEINDTCGHGVGDMVLQHLARRMTAMISRGEVVARLGGDEFGAAKVFTDDAEITGFLDRLRDCCVAPFDLDDRDFRLGASIGVSLFPDDGNDREQLLNNADLAMYRAKISLGESIAYYAPEMDEAARERRQLGNDLRHALDNGELSLLYQPQHDLETGKLNGYEALIRWRHPEKGQVPPDEFIPIAEENGEIFRIGEWVLGEACREARRWDQPLKIAVNLSAVQLLQDDLFEVVTRILLETGLPPRRLELEITETAIVEDKPRALHFLRQIKALGVSIAMDDFGTGYSSLDTLHSFPFDKIKIDKSFLLRSQASGEARAIIRAVLALGKNLGVPVLAEGVETEAQLDLLKEGGCDEVQGYFFGRPAAPPSMRGEDAPPAEAGHGRGFTTGGEG